MAWLHRLFLSHLCRKIPHGVPTLQIQGYHRKSTLFSSKSDHLENLTPSTKGQ